MMARAVSGRTLLLRLRQQPECLVGYPKTKCAGREVNCPLAPSAFRRQCLSLAHSILIDNLTSWSEQKARLWKVLTRSKTDYFTTIADNKRENVRLCSEGWYSELSGVCRTAELLGRSVKVKKFWKVDGSLMRNDLKANQRQFVFDPLLNR